MKPTKAQAKQARLKKQICQVLLNYNRERVFSAHDMASAMGEIWSRPPNPREVSHALIRLGKERIIVRARHWETQRNEGHTNMWMKNPDWSRWDEV